MSLSQIPAARGDQLGAAQWWWKEYEATEGRDVTHELEKTFVPNDTVIATRQSIKDNWFGATKFPSEIHVELLERKVIPHPYIGFNEHVVQWVGETEWLYTCTFDALHAREGLAGVLTFDGLDTLCDVYLNGNLIFRTDNAFRQYLYDTRNGDALQAKGNALLLHFRSAKAFAAQEEAVYGKVRAGSTNLGDPSRVYLRKPQYDWRWDWGPELMTCGPYRNVTLLTYAARIEDFYPQASIQASSTGNPFTFSLGSDLRIKLSPSTLGLLHDPISPPPFKVKLSLKDPKTPESNAIWTLAVDINRAVDIDDDAINISLPRIDSLQEAGLQPWWPVGYGGQNLYLAEVELVGPGGIIIDSVSKLIGFRSVQLVQEPLATADQHGTGSTFLFRINGVEMFMGGSNWIPADNFLTTISDERYRRWLTLLKDGGQNTVRIWGGGIYEPDIFYDICDELGILVWQDFQFACGVYPAHKSFVDSVRAEAQYNVKRLRHHPSIALFCGNNEDYQMVLQWGDVAQLPAIVIYEEVLPEVVEALTKGSIPYHRGSPYGGKGWDTSDPTVGDVHQWNIWGGKELPWQEYDRLGGRFVSEFGIPAMPAMKTIEYWMEGVNPRERYAQSKIMAQHTRAGAFERRFAITMNENFRLTTDLKQHAFNTQVMQAEAVGLAYRSWKREWKGPGKKYCGGVLIWQFNDCWPVTSWSLVDYFLRPKPAYYVIARSLAPLTINIVREVVQNRDNDRPKQFYEYGAIRSTSAKLHIWATWSGDITHPKAVKLDIQYFDLENPEWHPSHLFNPNDVETFALAPNQSTELGTFECPEPDILPSDGYNSPGTTRTGRVVVSTRLLDPDTGEVLARFVDWPQPYRLLDIPNPGVKLDVGKSSDGYTVIRVSVQRPVKCLFLAAEDEDRENGEFEEMRWSDNALDVVPFDDQVVKVSGGRYTKLTAQFLKN